MVACALSGETGGLLAEGERWGKDGGGPSGGGSPAAADDGAERARQGERGLRRAEGEPVPVELTCYWTLSCGDITYHFGRKT